MLSVFPTTLARNLETAVIVSGVRTPIGCLGGFLSHLSGPEIGAIAVHEAVERVGFPDDVLVEELILGSCLFGGQGQAPSKLVSVLSNLPNSTVTTMVNKVCASGIKAIMHSAERIMCGNRDIIVSGGYESMSQAPYYLMDGRYGYQFGAATIQDGIEFDGLVDITGILMGDVGDNFAKHFGCSRERQDEYVAESFRRAELAFSEGRMDDEVLPLDFGNGILFRDEQLSKVNYEKIPKLRPAFSEDGTLTAANCSPLSDGSCAVVLMSESAAREQGIEPLARILGFDDAEQKSTHVCSSPSLAIRLAVENAGLELGDIDFFEFHEPFAAVPCVNMDLLDIDHSICNLNGGTIPFGHPLGMSGARIVITLMNVLEQQNAGEIGVCVTCNGGGGASSMVIERL